MKTVPVTGGYFATVDDEDFEDVARYAWSRVVSKHSNTVYCQRYLGEYGKYLSMHRHIMEAPKGKNVDHIDGNGLNNCRENLRLCSHRENCGNTGKFRAATSKYKGVHFYKRYNSWMAYICPDGKKLHLGYFSDEVSAAKAYNEAASKHFGEFARLNEF